MALCAGSHDKIPWLLFDFELPLQLQVLQLKLSLSDFRGTLVFILLLKGLTGPVFHDHLKYLA